jgi:hypothetical protein
MRSSRFATPQARLDGVIFYNMAQFGEDLVLPKLLVVCPNYERSAFAAASISGDEMVMGAAEDFPAIF